MVEKRKVVLVGTGFVGMSMAYALLNQGGINELVLIDVAKEKAIGEAMDLSDGIPCSPARMVIKAGDYSECKDANIVVITAGVPQKPGETRLDLLQTNSKIIKEITKNIVKSGFNGIFLIASNPVDILSHMVQKISGFPSSRVIGTGTVLDTARLRFLLGEYLHVSSKNIHAYIMGEHGDSSFVPWSKSYVGCKPLVDILKQKGEEKSILDKFQKKVRDEAYEIIERKKSTYYGIGLALTKIIKAILNNEHEILTVSTLLNGEYGKQNVYMGVPAIITNTGIQEILQLELTKEENEKFEQSYNQIQQNQLTVNIKKDIIPK